MAERDEPARMGPLERAVTLIRRVIIGWLVFAVLAIGLMVYLASR